MRTPFHSAVALETYMRPAALTLFLCGILVYALFQARYLIHGPQIILHAPTETVHHERIVLLKGEAKHITAITLNGREIFTDEHGVFEEPLVLENGYTIMTLHAKNRYGRTIDMTRSFIYKGDTAIN
ncbi:MAG: hypothetical protein LR017_02395 [Candidatus Pacebacteria bacterium]|jgi:hypothetical protein|nr:hypothetical protein [Candidatus Paceibacterota bacterium]